MAKRRCLCSRLGMGTISPQRVEKQTRPRPPPPPRRTAEQIGANIECNAVSAVHVTHHFLKRMVGALSQRCQGELRRGDGRCGPGWARLLHSRCLATFETLGRPSPQPLGGRQPQGLLRLGTPACQGPPSKLSTIMNSALPKALGWLTDPPMQKHANARRTPTSRAVSS